MHSHFLKKTLYFSGCWLFLNKWNDESVVTNITPPYNFNSPHRGLSPHKCKKKFCPHKILANFEIKSPHYNGGDRNHVFSGCTVLADSKETKLRIKEASPSVGKNIGVVLVLCWCIEVCPYSYFGWCGYFLRSLHVICYSKWVLSKGHKNYQKDWCLMNWPTFLFLIYF